MDLAGWVPIYAYFAGNELMLDWCYTGSQRFTEPFFPDMIDRICWDYGVRMFRHQTTAAAAKEWVGGNPGLAPSGFIFHMSRCGSTLVSQMLAALPKNRVLSEPAALHAPLRAALLDRGISREQAVEWLRTIVGALGRPLPGESHYFLKLDCWHVLGLPLFLEAFPSTPWMFLYRSPAEVLVSQMRACGAWAVPSALDPRIFGPGSAGLTPCEYRAHALSKICEAALNAYGAGKGMLVNYDQLPEIACGALLQHFAVRYEGSEVARMRETAQSDAKAPQFPFSDDRQAKRNAVTPGIQSAVDRFLAPVFHRLEEIRKGSTTR